MRSVSQTSAHWSSPRLPVSPGSVRSVYVRIHISSANGMLFFLQRNFFSFEAIQAHESECAFAIVTCPHAGCHISLLRNEACANSIVFVVGSSFSKRNTLCLQLDNHLSVCVEAPVACPMASYGCPTRLRRKEIDTHAQQCTFVQVCVTCDTDCLALRMFIVPVSFRLLQLKPMVTHLSSRFDSLQQAFDQVKSENRMLTQKLGKLESGNFGTLNFILVRS